MLRRSLFILGVAAVLTGPVRADSLADGLAAYDRKDYAKAAALLRPLAEAGDVEAQIRMGTLSLYGRGVPESDAAAFDWFSKAAAQGNREGQFQLGNLYAFGLGVPKSETDPDRKAAEWYFEAARRGHPAAQYSLGILFLTGKGVEQSNPEAMKWMRRAAEAGHEDAKKFVQGYKGD